MKISNPDELPIIRMWAALRLSMKVQVYPDGPWCSASGYTVSVIDYWADPVHKYRTVQNWEFELGETR